jgi:hypothetical protein
VTRTDRIAAALTVAMLSPIYVATALGWLIGQVQFAYLALEMQVKAAHELKGESQQ